MCKVYTYMLMMSDFHHPNVGMHKIITIINNNYKLFVDVWTDICKASNKPTHLPTVKYLAIIKDLKRLC